MTLSAAYVRIDMQGIREMPGSGKIILIHLQTFSQHNTTPASPVEERKTDGR